MAARNAAPAGCRNRAVRLLISGGVFVEEVAGRRRLGGSGLTAAIAAARYGAEVSLASWIGEAEADEAFALLDAAGVDRLGVAVLDGLTTTYRMSDPGDLSMPLPQLVQGAVPSGPLPALPSAGVVLCIGTPGFDVISERWIDRPSEGGVLLFDRQGSHSRVLGARMASTVPAARRLLLTNVHEARAETAAADLEGAIARLPPEGFDAALVKAGPWGVTLVRTSLAPVGAYDVSVRSTIGSGDVFAGVLAAGLCAGDELADAAASAAAASAVWISRDEAQPPADLAEQAARLRATQAVWVDRRRLEALRFDVQMEPAVERRVRERITRGLRYLGMDTLHTDRDMVRALDLRSAGEGSDPVSAAIHAAIAEARASLGVTIPPSS